VIWGRDLRRAGVLGINQRNAGYTLRWNPRRFYPRVDDKLLTKELCAAACIPTPKLLAVARLHSELSTLMPALERHRSFVIKPARGAMGNGILVIRDREAHRFRRSDGSWLEEADVLYHAASIISGLFALAGHEDAAFAEECLIVHPSMAAISKDGVPDLRIVVYRGVPVMSMTRLPTKRSRGRANLHQGAVGAGVSLITGRITRAVLRSVPTDLHPDTGEGLVGREIPDFDRALEIAVRATDATELGYVGADVVIDANQGALILELNARPGLAIQIANAAGLKPRLDAVDREWRPNLGVDERIALGRSVIASLRGQGNAA
jgi:alpha-L-glutamate ligase-like protein